MMENFDDDFQNLLLLQGNEATIDEFEKGYCALLIEVRERMGRARTTEEIRACAAQGGRLRALLVQQIAFVAGLKNTSIEEADLAAIPAVEA